ncbi:MAG TPA: hypothetical protein VMH04_17470 [Candidatus Solibacter sp.]|nr:hypothetical protein [Candidatus Solibacter sp.]
MKLRLFAIFTLATLLCTLLCAQEPKIAVPGTITGVTAGTDLTGGGTSGNVTLNLDITKVPQLKAANAFTGNQSVKGNLSATGTVNGASFLLGGTPFAFGSAANDNSFLGFAGNSTSTGTSNTAVGSLALGANQSGYANTAIGVASMQENTTGAYNTAVGGALESNISGFENTAVGVAAMVNNQSGGFNAALGVYSLEFNSTGGENTAVGMESGEGNVTGSNNTFLGFNSSTSVDPISNATAIGANSVVSASNAMILGGTGSSSVTVGIGTAAPYNDYALDVETIHSNGIINGGVVVNANGGNLYLGMTNTVHKFRVDLNGAVYADGGLFASGADFAESVAVRGSRSSYEPGDVLEIDSTADRHITLSHEPYATLVAGIYSTKPGLLASPHHMDDSAVTTREVPLAVMGIVPCKVTTENGPIQRGDLLVTSSRPGYAMKGTERSRMLGAVVGKAMEPLAKGTGTIEMLVTLQ